MGILKATGKTGNRKLEWEFAQKKREETTARKYICSLTSPGMTCDGAYGDLVHKLRNTTRDFEFHLYCLVQQSKLEYLYEKKTGTHAHRSWAMMLAKSSPTDT